MLRLEMLPAHHGDALLVEYGTGPRHRILIDGRTPESLDAVDARWQRSATSSISSCSSSHT
jgi:hypothetical protein